MDTGLISGCCEILKREINFKTGKRGSFLDRPKEKERGKNELLSRFYTEVSLKRVKIDYFFPQGAEGRVSRGACIQGRINNFPRGGPESNGAQSAPKFFSAPSGPSPVRLGYTVS